MLAAAAVTAGSRASTAAAAARRASPARSAALNFGSGSCRMAPLQQDSGVKGVHTQRSDWKPQAHLKGTHLVWVEEAIHNKYLGGLLSSCPLYNRSALCLQGMAACCGLRDFLKGANKTAKTCCKPRIL